MGYQKVALKDIWARWTGKIVGKALARTADRYEMSSGLS